MPPKGVFACRSTGIVLHKLCYLCIGSGHGRHTRQRRHVWKALPPPDNAVAPQSPQRPDLSIRTARFARSSHGCPARAGSVDARRIAARGETGRRSTGVLRTDGQPAVGDREGRRRRDQPGCEVAATESSTTSLKRLARSCCGHRTIEPITVSGTPSVGTPPAAEHNDATADQM